jgi:hypothetical protein
MYKMLMGTVLQQVGIIEKRPKKQWIWVSTTEPNIHMAEALIKACSTKVNKLKDNKPFSKEQTLPENELRTIHNPEKSHISGTIKNLEGFVKDEILDIMISRNQPNHIFNIKQEGKFILIW